MGLNLVVVPRKKSLSLNVYVDEENKSMLSLEELRYVKAHSSRKCLPALEGG